MRLSYVWLSSAVVATLLLLASATRRPTDLNVNIDRLIASIYLSILQPSIHSVLMDGEHLHFGWQWCCFSTVVYLQNYFTLRRTIFNFKVLCTHFHFEITVNLKRKRTTYWFPFLTFFDFSPRVLDSWAVLHMIYILHTETDLLLHNSNGGRGGGERYGCPEESFPGGAAPCTRLSDRLTVVVYWIIEI